MLRRDCQHHLRYASRSFCRYVWVKDPRAESRELPFGCDTEIVDTETGKKQLVHCPEYNPLVWKRQQLPLDEQMALEEDEVPRRLALEWDDVEEETHGPPTSTR